MDRPDRERYRQNEMKVEFVFSAMRALFVRLLQGQTVASVEWST